MKISNKAAKDVRVGDYVFTGQRDRYGKRPHPAYHWTRVHEVKTIGSSIALRVGGVWHWHHPQEGVAVNIDATKAGRKADEFLELFDEQSEFD